MHIDLSVVCLRTCLCSCLCTCAGWGRGSIITATAAYTQTRPSRSCSLRLSRSTGVALQPPIYSFLFTSSLRLSRSTGVALFHMSAYSTFRACFIWNNSLSEHLFMEAPREYKNTDVDKKAFIYISAYLQGALFRMGALFFLKHRLLHESVRW